MSTTLYKLTMPDPSVPAFCTLYKTYIGDEEAMKRVHDAVCNFDPISPLARSMEDYWKGNKDAKNMLLYEDAPIFTEVVPTAMYDILLKDFSWTHYNAWESPYEMKCDEMNVYFILTKDSETGEYLIHAKPSFKNLAYKNELAERDVLLRESFWGNPGVLFQEEKERNVIVTKSDVYIEVYRCKDEKEAYRFLEDAIKPNIKDPNQFLVPIMDEAFGDG